MSKDVYVTYNYAKLWKESGVESRKPYGLSSNIFGYPQTVCRMHLLFTYIRNVKLKKQNKNCMKNFKLPKQ